MGALYITIALWFLGYKDGLLQGSDGKQIRGEAPPAAAGGRSPFILFCSFCSLFSCCSDVALKLLCCHCEQLCLYRTLHAEANLVLGILALPDLVEFSFSFFFCVQMCPGLRWQQNGSTPRVP